MTQSLEKADKNRKYIAEPEGILWDVEDTEGQEIQCYCAFIPIPLSFLCCTAQCTAFENVEIGTVLPLSRELAGTETLAAYCLFPEISQYFTCSTFDRNMCISKSFCTYILTSPRSLRIEVTVLAQSPFQKQVADEVSPMLSHTVPSAGERS